MRQNFLIAIAFILISPTLNQQVLTNIPFECKGRVDGFWRDLKYCDVFHACIAGEQKRSYGCPQVGDRFYFDDTTQKCEFASRNTAGCPANQYYTQVTNATTDSASQLTTTAPTEQWKIFVLSKEQFSCAGKQNAFYASRWCNVFYRCVDGAYNAFLCPLQKGSGRLWWIQHGQSQGVPEASAACAFPCETGRQCSSAGGILVENGNQISESQQEAEAAYKQSSCSNQTGQTGQTSVGQISVGQTTTRQSGAGQVVGVGNGQTGGGNQGSSSNTEALFTVDSDVSCNGQASGVYLSSHYCNVFHRCVSGIRFDFRCARAINTSYDLWWNQQTNLCDWPCRVQCNNPLYGSSTSAQQVSSDSLVFFNNDCRAYPPIFN